MKYLKIQNNGELDIRLVALMGGTTKSGDRFKIGQFGTGLKYTLAYLFRNNIDFKIFSGEEPINISTEKENIKGADFEIICIEGHRTSITTSMGQQWDAWMIIRELWCNALDEGGNTKEIVGDEALLSGVTGTTSFYIQLTPDIRSVLDNWKSYFIHHFEPIWENESYAIYPNRSDGKLKLYKNGVLIYQHPNTKSLFLYDIKRADINELREFRGVTSYEVFKALAQPNQEVVSYFLQNVNEEHYEGSELEYDWFTSFANVWRDTIGNNRIANSGDYEYYKDRGVDIDFSNVIQLPKRVYKALIKSFEGIGAMVMSDAKIEFFQIPDTRMTAKVNDCLALLADCGYTYDATIKFQVGAFREITRLSGASINSNLVMIADVCNDLPNEKMCAILVEEIEYLKVKAEKSVKEYRNHFINLYTRQLLATNAIEI
jgi:hypothetical protein